MMEKRPFHRARGYGRSFWRPCEVKINDEKFLVSTCIGEEMMEKF
jgi:hypothetical protein